MRCSVCTSFASTMTMHWSSIEKPLTIVWDLWDLLHPDFVCVCACFFALNKASATLATLMALFGWQHFCVAFFLDNFLYCTENIVHVKTLTLYTNKQPRLHKLIPVQPKPRPKLSGQKTSESIEDKKKRLKQRTFIE